LKNKVISILAQIKLSVFKLSLLFTKRKRYFNIILFIYLVYIIATAEDRRTTDKKHSCFFCQKEYSKIARHLEQVHKEEDEVKEA
jgi:hypothetical protein